MKYQSIPEKVDAVQFLGLKDGEPQWSDNPRWLKQRLSLYNREGVITKSSWTKGVYIGLDHPDYTLYPGTWLVKRARTECVIVYPNAIFHKAYKPCTRPSE